MSEASRQKDRRRQKNESKLRYGRRRTGRKLIIAIKSKTLYKSINLTFKNFNHFKEKQMSQNGKRLCILCIISLNKKGSPVERKRKFSVCQEVALVAKQKEHL